MPCSGRWAARPEVRRAGLQEQPAAATEEPGRSARACETAGAQPAGPGGSAGRSDAELGLLCPAHAGPAGDPVCSPAGGNQVPLAFAPARQVAYNQQGAIAADGGPMPMHLPGSGVGIAPARYDHPYDAGLRLAVLRGSPELRRGDLSEAVLAHGLAVHRTVLSLSASPAGLAESDPGMGRRLVDAGLQRSPHTYNH